MTNSDSVTVLVERLRAGDDNAAAQLWERFFDRMAAAARGRMRSSGGGMSDEEDIVVSAFKSFCVGLKAGRFGQLEGRDSLWRLLLVITARKVADQFAFDRRQKRDIGRTANNHEDDDRQLVQNLVCREPTPELAAEISEQIATRLEALEQPDLKQVALLKMEGYTNDEIARELDRGLSTVERKLRTIRAIWSQVE